MEHSQVALGKVGIGKPRRDQISYLSLFWHYFGGMWKLVASTLCDQISPQDWRQGKRRRHEIASEMNVLHQSATLHRAIVKGLKFATDLAYCRPHFHLCIAKAIQNMEPEQEHWSLAQHQARGCLCTALKITQEACMDTNQKGTSGKPRRTCGWACIDKQRAWLWSR